MARVTVEDCIDKVDNRFELVLLASHRARLISQGAAITIDRDGQAWFPRIFGQGGYSVIREADRLAGALPDIYRHLVG